MVAPSPSPSPSPFDLRLVLIWRSRKLIHDFICKHLQEIVNEVQNSKDIILRNTVQCDHYPLSCNCSIRYTNIVHNTMKSNIMYRAIIKFHTLAYIQREVFLKTKHRWLLFCFLSQGKFFKIFELGDERLRFEHTAHTLTRVEIPTELGNY